MEEGDEGEEGEVTAVDKRKVKGKKDESDESEEDLRTKMLKEIQCKTCLIPSFSYCTFRIYLIPIVLSLSLLLAEIRTYREAADALMHPISALQGRRRKLHKKSLPPQGRNGNGRKQRMRREEEDDEEEDEEGDGSKRDGNEDERAANENCSIS